MGNSSLRRPAFFVALAGMALVLTATAGAQDKGIFLVNRTGGMPRSGEVLRWRMDAAGTFLNETLFDYTRYDFGVCIGTGDFNGDGWTDSLWRLTASTLVVVYQLDGMVIHTEEVDQSIDSSITPRGVGDFNGDSVPDILMQDSNFRATVWTMGGAFGNEVQTEIVLGKTTKNGFDRYCGFADVDNDGMADVILQRTLRDLIHWKSTGTDVERTMEGRPAESGLTRVNKKIGLYGRLFVIGAMDVNGDGFDDLVCRFRDDNGRDLVWVLYDDGSGSYPLSWQTRYRAAHFKVPFGVGKF